MCDLTCSWQLDAKGVKLVYDKLDRDGGGVTIDPSLHLHPNLALALALTLTLTLTLALTLILALSLHINSHPKPKRPWQHGNILVLTPFPVSLRDSWL